MLGNVLDASGLVRRRLDGGLITAAFADAARTSSTEDKKTLNDRISNT